MDSLGLVAADILTLVQSPLVGSKLLIEQHFRVVVLPENRDDREPRRDDRHAARHNFVKWLVGVVDVFFYFFICRHMFG